MVLVALAAACVRGGSLQPDQANLPVRADGPLPVAVKEAPPFAYKNAAGEWSGVSVELWQRVMGSVGRETSFTETTSEDLLRVLDGQGSAVNHYLRRLHNLALGLGWWAAVQLFLRAPTQFVEVPQAMIWVIEGSTRPLHHAGNCEYSLSPRQQVIAHIAEAKALCSAVR